MLSQIDFLAATQKSAVDASRHQGASGRDRYAKFFQKVCIAANISRNDPRRSIIINKEGVIL